MTKHNSLIGGKWVEVGKYHDNLNPSDITDVIGSYSYGDAGSVDAAVEAAKAAQVAWRNTTPQTRHDLLEAVGNTIAKRSGDIGRVLSREEGKTLAEGIGETMRASQIFKFFAGECLRQVGDIQPSVRPDIDVEMSREPVGIVGLVTPWNFPIAIPAWKIAPALAFGNCVILKPADLTPACAHIIAEILTECGCPDGVFNLVLGRGSVVGEALVNHPDINAISFTGSVATGHRIAETCGKMLKKVQLEMGGKNPMIVLNDADLAIAVPACINGTFFSTGQRCTASSRLIVEDGIHDAFVEEMTKALKQLKIGDALDADTQIGPVVDSKQLNSNLSYVDLAGTEGAEVIGGERMETEKLGFYQEPALFLNTHNNMRINREEIFGPCGSVIKVGGFDEAVAIANDTDFGLTGGICTQNLKRARDYKRQAEVGMVMVNLPTAGVDYHVAFGGRKASSFGPREQGRYAAEFYTTVKTSYIFAG